MKEFVKFVVFIGACLFLIPLIIVYAGGYHDENLLQAVTSQGEKDGQNSGAFIEEGKIIGILAKEIPYTYEYETIKAQTVIVRTYLARRMLGIETKGELSGYTLEEMKEVWGENYNDIYATYQEAVKETQNEIILYNNEPIEAVYHKASGGRTRAAKDVYNADIPYLKSVDSTQDHITKQVELTKKEIAEKFKEKYPDIVIDADTLENQIQIIEKDEAEYIKNIQLGNTMISGEDFRKVLELPSSNFKIFNHNDNLIFDVKGVGHGVGFSQNGANELAKKGKNYKDILKYYYTDVTIENYIYKK